MSRGRVVIWRSWGCWSHDWMIFWAKGSSPRPAPVALPVGGEHVFSSTTTSHPAAISACAQDIPAMLPPTTTAFFFLFSSISLSLSGFSWFRVKAQLEDNRNHLSLFLFVWVQQEINWTRVTLHFIAFSFLFFYFPFLIFGQHFVFGSKPSCSPPKSIISWLCVDKSLFTTIVGSIHSLIWTTRNIFSNQTI